MEIPLMDVVIDVPAAHPVGFGRTPGSVLEDLKKSIDWDDAESFSLHLAELERLLPDDKTVGEQLAASGALCNAAAIGSIPKMNTLIQKGVDINTKSHNPWVGGECTPLYVATWIDNHEAAVRYLVDNGANVNIKGYKGKTPLHVAVENGSADTVRYLINKGANVNIKDDNGKTPLHVAAESHNADVVRYLGEKGADVNVRDNNGQAPLHVAARSHNAGTANYLGDKGADVNIRDDSGKTPLHVAAETHNVDTVKYLGDKGADVNIKDDEGNTPLHLAAKEGYHDAVRCLVENGADVNIRNHHGTTPLRMATRKCHKDTQKYLVDQGADVNIKDGEDALEDLTKVIQEGDVESFNRQLTEVEEFFQRDNTMGERLATSGVLCYAALAGSTPVMDTLIQKGVDVNTKSNIEIDGYERQLTPLHVAAESGNVDTVRYIVEKGVDVNIKDNIGLTPLHDAARSGNVETVRYLVDNGADVHIKDSFTGWTPLHVAARRGNVETVRCLVDNGAGVNIKGYKGVTPLHEAAGFGNLDTVQYLVDNGADVDIKDDNGCTPLHEATKSGNVDTVIYLGDRVADVNSKDDNGCTPLHEAAKSGNADTVRCIVEKGADVDIKAGYWGYTPLYEAARSDNVDTVRYLVENGAGIDIKDGYLGWTPLYVAARYGNVGTVRYLGDMGADINIKDAAGKTPLHVAVRSGSFDTVRYLVDKGADVNITDDEGQTPLHWACDGGSTETVKYLLEKGADPTAKDKDGENSLASAIDSRRNDVAALLLDHDIGEESMLRSSLRGTTLMRKLIAFMPDVAEVAFNKCVTTNEGKEDSKGNEVHATSETFEVDYNYEFLEDFPDKHSSDSAESWRPKKFTKYNHPLYLIKKHGCSSLLKHPLVISLLDYKWTTFGRYQFFGNLFIYLVFLAFLTGYGLTVLSPLEKTCVDVLNGSFSGTAPEDCEGLSVHEYRFLYVGAALTFLTAFVRMAAEIVQLCRHPLQYLLDWVNCWQWQFGVVAVFLGWVGLINFLQKWPVTGVYVLMFVNIIGSFAKIAFLAVLLVIAFALAFYMLFFEPDEMRTGFSHPGRAIVKVMAMTIGELDYDNLYHQEEGDDEIAFLSVSFLLWIIFLVLMPVLLSNLLVGLAVGDVDRLQKTASENRIELQIDLVLSFEELLESLGIRHRCVIKQSKTHYPNVPVTLLPRWCKRGTSDSLLVHNAEHAKVRKKMAKWYSKLWVTDEYQTSGESVSDAIKLPPDSLEEELRKQSEHQSEQLETKLKEQSEQQGRQIEAKLKEQSDQFEAKLTEQLEAKLLEHGGKQNEQFHEAIRQLSDCHKELAKQSEEQAKKMEEHTEQLAGEVASLREALQKLITQMATK